MSPSDVKPFHAEGHAYPPLSSRRIPARLVWRDGGMARLQDHDGNLLTDGVPLGIEQIPGGPLLVELPGDWQFEAAPGSDVSTLPGPRKGRRLSRAEAWHPRLALVVGLCLFAAFAIWRWGLSVLVAVAMWVTPESVVKVIDAGNMAVIDRTFADDSRTSAARQKEVQAIFARLREQAPPAPWGEYRLLFRDMPAIGPNAFAMPGGTVVVTDQLLERFDDPDVIAGVLGHELAHVSERHVLAQLYRAGTSYLLVTLIAGDPGPLLQDMLREGNLLLSLSYSRHHEAEADRLGVATATAAGYDGVALARFFEALEEDFGADGPSWLSTHPAHGDRIERIRDMAGSQ
ncbi:M48 family metallopeptidase [Paracoccus caeni]|uniref:M48 family metallopeptidase n=1 Tax=Paracoccus caeni TaxID=657651 RepID=UPI002D7E5864|nr:M48 family metallopeptidase [Paracoccus caeni]